MIARAVFHRILSQLRAGGVIVHYWDGKVNKYGPDEPYFEMTIHEPKVIRAILRSPTLGFGEGYMDGGIDLAGPITGVGQLAAANSTTLAALSRLALPRRATPNRPGVQRQQISRHYDLGNEFYSLWLDESMTYSCAYYHKPTDSLEAAQDQKVDYILRKLQLEPGQSLLDIGCGWGKLLITAARKYGITGHGITLSKEQFKLAADRVKAAGLAGKITIELVNYQDLAARNIKFDRIVSVGMYEHVGRGNHATYFRAIDKLLASDGLSVLHTITSPTRLPNDPWNDKYIFPGGYLPAVSDTARFIEDFGFELKDFENLRYHYALTIDEWLRRFEDHKTEVIRRYGQAFYRMWRLYLGTSISGFRYGDLALGQFVFTKGPRPNSPLTREYLYQ